MAFMVGIASSPNGCHVDAASHHAHLPETHEVLSFPSYALYHSNLALSSPTDVHPTLKVKRHFQENTKL